jgi:hypothetical protein
LYHVGCVDHLLLGTWGVQQGLDRELLDNHTLHCPGFLDLAHSSAYQGRCIGLAKDDVARERLVEFHVDLAYQSHYSIGSRFVDVGYMVEVWPDHRLNQERCFVVEMGCLGWILEEDRCWEIVEKSLLVDVEAMGLVVEE